MTPRFLLDTNALSEPLRPRPSRRFLEQVEQHGTELATASIVWHELWFGAERLPRSRKRQAIEAYLIDRVGATLPILPYDTQAARWHALERARLAKTGRPTAFRDGQIAAVAHVHGLVVVTANTSDFEPFEGVEVANWL